MSSKGDVHVFRGKYYLPRVNRNGMALTPLYALQANVFPGFTVTELSQKFMSLGVALHQPDSKEIKHLNSIRGFESAGRCSAESILIPIVDLNENYSQLCRAYRKERAHAVLQNPVEAATDKTSPNGSISPAQVESTGEQKIHEDAGQDKSGTTSVMPLQEQAGNRDHASREKSTDVQPSNEGKPKKRNSLMPLQQQAGNRDHASREKSTDVQPSNEGKPKKRNSLLKLRLVRIEDLLEGEQHAKGESMQAKYKSVAVAEANDTRHQTPLLPTGSSVATGSHPVERNPSGSHPAERNTSGSHPSERNTSVSPPAKRNTSGSHPAERNASGSHPAERNTSGSHPAERNPSGSHPAERNTSGSHPPQRNTSGSHPAKRNTSGSHPAEHNTSGNQPVERNTSSCHLAERTTSGSHPSEQTTSGSHPSERNNSGSPPAKRNTSGSHPAEQNTSGSHPAERNTSGARRVSQQARHIGSIPLSTGKKVDVVQRNRLYVRAKSITSAVPGFTKHTLKQLCPVFGLEWLIVDTSDNAVTKCFEQISSKKLLSPMMYVRASSKLALFALLSFLEEHFCKVESKERPTAKKAVEIARKEMAKTPERSGVFYINGHSVTRVVLDGQVYFSGPQVLSAVSNTQQKDDTTTSDTNSVMEIVSVFTTGIEYILGPPAVMKVLNNTTSAQHLTPDDFRVFKVGDEEIFHIVIKQLVEGRPSLCEAHSLTSKDHSNRDAPATKRAEVVLHRVDLNVAQPSETAEAISSVCSDNANIKVDDARRTRSDDDGKMSCKGRTCPKAVKKQYAGTFYLRNPSKKELSGADRELLRKHAKKLTSSAPLVVLPCVVLDGSKFCCLSDVHQLVPHKSVEDIVEVCHALGLQTRSERVEVPDRASLLKILQIVMGLPGSSNSVQGSVDGEDSFSTCSTSVLESQSDLNPDRYSPVSGQSQQHLDGGIVSVGKSKVPWLYHQEVDMATVDDVENAIPSASLDGVQRYEMPPWGPEVLNRYATTAGLSQVYNINQQLVPLRSLDCRDTDIVPTVPHTGHPEDASEDLSHGVQQSEGNMEVDGEHLDDKSERSVAVEVVKQSEGNMEVDGEHLDDKSERSVAVEVVKQSEGNMEVDGEHLDDKSERSVAVEVVKQSEGNIEVDGEHLDDKSDKSVAVEVVQQSEENMEVAEEHDPEKSVAVEVVRTKELSDNVFNPNGDTETATTMNTDVNENECGTGEHNFDLCNVKKEASAYPSPCSNMNQGDDDIVVEPPCKRHCVSLGTDPDAAEKSTSNVSWTKRSLVEGTPTPQPRQTAIRISNCWSTASDEPASATRREPPPHSVVSEREQQLRNELRWETVADGAPIPVVERGGSRFVLTSDVSSLLRGVDAGEFMEALDELELSIVPCSLEVAACFSTDAGKPKQACRSMVKLNMTLGATVKMLLMILKEKGQPKEIHSTSQTHLFGPRTSQLQWLTVSWFHPIPMHHPPAASTSTIQPSCHTLERSREMQPQLFIITIIITHRVRDITYRSATRCLYMAIHSPLPLPLFIRCWLDNLLFRQRETVPRRTLSISTTTCRRRSVREVPTVNKHRLVRPKTTVLQAVL
ncbi:C17orf97 [Branchiostoma lanceolatum]|uniref:C17orf97 protein n=1 Tax=Branchiostoma lanceolatum TaxID=7740 RepID=A0A8K0EHG7_BRALA|nr:C17orf97 [Branchiostoma lanceolatum]